MPEVKIECPDCHKRAKITVPFLVTEGNTHVTVVQGICCEHSFTVSIDTHGDVRFYGRAIYEANKKSQKIAKKEEKRKQEEKVVNENLEDFFL